MYHLLNFVSIFQKDYEFPSFIGGLGI